MAAQPVELNRVIWVQVLGPNLLRWMFSREVWLKAGHGETSLQAWSLVDEWENPEKFVEGPPGKYVDAMYLVGSQAGRPWRIIADPAEWLNGGPFDWPANGLIEVP